jgi:hypothetical protein
MSGDAGAFVERLLLVLDEGRRTGTHKLALLLALMDAVEVAADGRGDDLPSTLRVSSLGWFIVERMLQQVLPFVPAGGGARDAIVLQQMRPNGKGDFVFHEVAVEARMLIEDADLTDLAGLRSHFPDQAADMESRLVGAAVKNPLPLCQTVAGIATPFLYDWPWPANASPRRVAADQGTQEPVVRFLPGAANLLLRFTPVLRPFVEARYVSDVGRYNGLDAQESALRDHLFGSERVRFPAVLRKELAKLQGDQCLYCSRPLTRAAVDHFVPWLRYPNNAVENLVLVDPRCNSRKSALLAAPTHVRAWTRDILARRELGTALAPNYVTVLSDLPRSVAVARRAYAQWPVGLPLWSESGQAVAMSERERGAVLAVLDAVPTAAVGAGDRRAAEHPAWFDPSDPP